MNMTVKMLTGAAFAAIFTLVSANAANIWTGSTDSDFNTGTNYVGDSWSEWTDYVFDSNAVNGTMSVDAFTGWGNISLNSGLTTNIVIEGSQPIIMAPAKLGVWEVPSLGGTIAIASDSKNLTISNTVLLAGELVMNVGSGRTLTANGAVQFWEGQGGTASLNKQGDGTALLTGNNSYSGATHINGGTLVVANNKALGVGGWSATSWTLLASGATLALQGNISLDEHMHVVGTGVGGHGAVRNLGGDNMLSMTYGNSGSGPGYAIDGNTTIGVDAGTLTITGFYHDSGSYGITKVGAGTMVLTQTSTYTGATTVNTGTLKLSGTLLLTDNFTANGNPNTYDLNYNLANRQSGSSATKSWTPSGNAQVGNATDVGQPGGTGNADYLLLAFGASATLGGMPLSSANVAGPLKITFDMFKGSTSTPDKWTSFAMSSTGSGWPVANSGEFGFLYRNNTGIQIFNNTNLVQNFSSTTGGDSFGFYLADAAGTGSPFSGNGTRLIVTQGGSVLGSYALDTGMGTSYLAFGTDGGDPGMIGGVDNLTVNAQQTNILDPSTQVNLTTAGAALELDNVLQTVAGLEGVAGTSVALGPLSRLTVNGSTDSTFSGVISGTLSGLTKSGTGMLTLSGTNTYGGTTTVSNGTLRIDGDSSGALGALTVVSGAFLGGNGSYGGSITLNDGAALSCVLNLTDSTLTCGGQLSFTNLNFATCFFTVAPGAGYPPYRVFTLIEADSLGTATFANAEGTIAGVPAKLSIKGNRLLLSVGPPGTLITIF